MLVVIPAVLLLHMSDPGRTPLDLSIDSIVAVTIAGITVLFHRNNSWRIKYYCHNGDFILLQNVSVIKLL